MDNPLAELVAWRLGSYEGDDDYAMILLGYTEGGAADRLDAPEDDRRARIEFATGNLMAEGERASWRLDVDGILESCWEGGGEPWWHEDHVLLAPWRDRHAWVSFSRPFVDPLRAWGAVAKAHAELAEGWLAADRFVRESMFDKPFGILAQGPERFMAAYEAALKEIGEDAAMAVPSQGRTTNQEPLSVVTCGDSHFVARSFRLVRTA